MHNILIIDDEESIIFTLESLLEDEGYKVFTASTADKGVEIARTQKIDLCIVDLNLPNKSGTETILDINTIKSKTKFVINTGEIGYEVPINLKNIGISSINVITKPILDIDIFTNKIKDLLQGD